MLYKGGCIVGVEMRTGATYPGNDNQGWPFLDGAWTPVADYYVAGTSYAIQLPPGGNAILLGTDVTINTRPDLSINFDQYALYVDNVANTTISFIGSTPRRLAITGDNALEDATQNNRLTYRSSMSGFSRVRGAEISMAKIQEMPYNQELTSYRRTRTAPTATEIKTMDGAIRRYVTGNASTSISATFRWSDNGGIARNLSEILEQAKTNAWPLLVYVPAGIYYDGPFLDLVMPTNDPTPIMPTPGNYELTIEGPCQP